MKRNVLVTLVNKYYIKHAKQLFSAIYWNAGWDGDYLLIAHEIPEKDLKWFREKGILIKKCKSLYKESTLNKVPKTPKWNNIMLAKLLLFKTYFKRWKNVVYIDVDVVVRASINALTKISGFAAAKDYLMLNRQFIVNSSNWKISKELEKKYDLNTESFNAGVLAFSTNIIKSDTYIKIKSIFNKYKRIINYADQSALNLFFYKKWKIIPAAYNTCILVPVKKSILNKLNAIIFHTIGEEKLWDKNSSLFDEWNRNLRKADLININQPQQPKKIWTPYEIRLHHVCLKLINFIKKNFKGQEIKIDQILNDRNMSKL